MSGEESGGKCAGVRDASEDVVVVGRASDCRVS